MSLIFSYNGDYIADFLESGYQRRCKNEINKENLIKSLERIFKYDGIDTIMEQCQERSRSRRFKENLKKRAINRIKVTKNRENLLDELKELHETKAYKDIREMYETKDPSNEQLIRWLF
jgi:hypothetical protein